MMMASLANAAQPSVNRWKYAAREAAIILVWLASPLACLLADTLTINVTRGLIEHADIQQAVAAIEALSSPLHIIVYYVTLKVARLIRDFVPSAETTHLEAYDVVALLLWIAILWKAVSFIVAAWPTA